MSRKKQEEISGIEKKQENLLVQKSRPLFSLWQSNFSLMEFKILDVYLARINSKDPDKKTVVFPKGEIEKLFGLKRMSKHDLDARLKNLGTPIDISKVDEDKIHRISLFEEAYAEKDENGSWVVRLTCTQIAMQYIFNVEELGYLRYKLRCITNLSSRYSYLLFIYLEANRFRKTWEIELEELKELMGCTNEQYYEFRRFNDKILKRCQNELLEKSECRFSYEPVKQGRKVIGVRFTVQSFISFLATENNDSAEGIPPAIDEAIEEELIKQYPDEEMRMYAGACDYSFSEIEMDFILENLFSAISKETEYGRSLVEKRYDFLLTNYKRLLLEEQREDREPIRNRCKYLLALMNEV